jgi:hypothetical protein
MFIQNKEGEVVNVDCIIAVKFYDDTKPYQINVFTEKTETIFEFNAQFEVMNAMDKLEGYLMRTNIRWAKCQNWLFRADKILAINDECCRNLTVSMVGRDFHVYLDAKDDETLMAYKRQIATSLSENFFDSNNPIFVRLS